MFMYKIDYLPKIALTRTEILLVSFLCMLFFISLLNCCFRRPEYNNTILHQNEGGGNSHKNINIPFPFYQSSFTPPLSSVKTKKNLRSIRKFQYARHILTEGFVFSSCRCSKQSVPHLLTLNWSEYLIWCSCFQISCGNNNTSVIIVCL